MNSLGELNIRCHNNRPLASDSNKLTIYDLSDKLVQCCIESTGCTFNKTTGSCIMCDYGAGRNLTQDELRYELNDKMKKYVRKERILFGSYGSILDNKEVSKECFQEVLKFVAENNIKTVIFETHYSTVNKEILEEIKNTLKNTRVIIEMGYEACDENILRNNLNRVTDLNKLTEVIKLIHQHEMMASLNVLLGIPFLNTQEQLRLAIDSINWAFKNGADHVVIFPCNIKPFTLLHKIYKTGKYKPISQWMIIELLNNVDERYINEITLSWYGDRQNFYEDKELKLIAPQDCEKCHDKLFKFYTDFMKEQDNIKRKALVNKIITESICCECREEFLEELKSDSSTYDIEDILSKLEA